MADMVNNVNGGNVSQNASDWKAGILGKVKTVGTHAACFGIGVGITYLVMKHIANGSSAKVAEIPAPVAPIGVAAEAVANAVN